MSAGDYKVLLASPWENLKNGTEGVTWTVVGRAFPSRDGRGMNVYIHANLSVTGMLVIKEDDGTDASYRGSEAEAQMAKSRKRRPTAHQPFPPDNGEPF